ncbi:MAG: hypothetical protein WBC44_03010 [Planctomycetaceae bacterium]
MPIWPVVRRSRPGSTRLTIAIALLGLLLTTGCRGDQSRQPGLSPFRPFPWLTKKDDAPPRDDFSLKPIPRGDTSTPPLPPPPSRSFSPPAAPAPEAAGPAAAGDYYGVRPTAAEESQAANPSWSHRFRNLFGSEPEEATTDSVIDQADTAPLLRPVPGS